MRGFLRIIFSDNKNQVRTSKQADEVVIPTNRRKPTKAWAITQAQPNALPGKRTHAPTTSAETLLQPPSPLRVSPSLAPLPPPASGAAAAALLDQGSVDSKSPSRRAKRTVQIAKHCFAGNFVRKSQGPAFASFEMARLSRPSTKGPSDLSCMH